MTEDLDKLDELNKLMEEHQTDKLVIVATEDVEETANNVPGMIVLGYDSIVPGTQPVIVTRKKRKIFHWSN